MKSVSDSQVSILTSLARRQKVANLFLLLVLIFAMVALQQAIDTKIALGSGNLVYWIAGLSLLLLWWILTLVPSGHSKGLHYLINKGEVHVRSENYDDDRKLLLAYVNVTKKLNLNPQDYNLSIQKEDDHNAFASGLSKGKTICVNSHSITVSTDHELEAVLAHEFGHILNRDAAFSAIRTSFGCGIGIPIGIFSFGVLWTYWGFWVALLLTIVSVLISYVVSKNFPQISRFVPDLIALIAINILWGPIAVSIFYLFTVIVMPTAISNASKITEEYADSFATHYGYGEGLISFFKKLKPNKGLEFFSSHPFQVTRIKYIRKVIAGYEGRISEATERWIWFVVKSIFVALSACYLYLYTHASLNTVYLFLTSGALFIVADNLLYSNSGSWHIAINTKADRTKLNLPTCISGILMLLGYLFLYLCGLYATYQFMHLQEGTTILFSLATICFYAWLSKPIVSLIGNWNDMLSTVSDFTTYFAVVTSLLMMVSFFYTIPF